MHAAIPENINVLLVEDDVVDFETVRREFKKHNIRNPVFHATSGVDALAILRGDNQNQKIKAPYVMLVDINMPKMNGLDFLKEVRNDNNLKDSIAFILTTSAREEDIQAAYELNAAGYFLKDNMNDLVNMLSVYRQINKFPDTHCAGA